GLYPVLPEITVLIASSLFQLGHHLRLKLRVPELIQSHRGLRMKRRIVDLCEKVVPRKSLGLFPGKLAWTLCGADRHRRSSGNGFSFFCIPAINAVGQQPRAVLLMKPTVALPASPRHILVGSPSEHRGYRTCRDGIGSGWGMHAHYSVCN